MLYDVHGFSRKWLQSVRDDQCEDGLPAAFSPDSARIRHHPGNPSRVMGGSAGWGDATVLVPWAIYEAYGDTELLAESWDSMTRWVDYALHLAKTAATRPGSPAQRHRSPTSSTSGMPPSTTENGSSPNAAGQTGPSSTPWPKIPTPT